MLANTFTCFLTTPTFPHTHTHTPFTPPEVLLPFPSDSWLPKQNKCHRNVTGALRSLVPYAYGKELLCAKRFSRGTRVNRGFLFSNELTIKSRRATAHTCFHPSLPCDQASFLRRCHSFCDQPDVWGQRVRERQRQGQRLQR